MAAFGLDPNLALIIAGVLIVLGLALAFWGRAILKMLMALIGMILGGILGYLIGAIVITGGSALLAIGLGIVGAFLGLILFWKLVKIGLALVLGILAAALVLGSFGVPSGIGVGDARVVGAVLAFLVVFALSYYFIEELIGIITALIGGILVGVGAFLLLGPGTAGGVATWIVAAAAGGVIFLLGAFVQTRRVRRQKRIAAAVSTPPAVAPPPPPPPPAQ